MDPRLELERKVGEGDESIAFSGLYVSDRIAKPVTAVRKRDTRLAQSPTAASNEARLEETDRAELVRRLDHPHIAMPFDYITHEGIEFAVFEGADARSLADGTSSVNVTAVRNQLLETGAHMHKQRIVHRDIKPANIIVYNGKHTKIIDFGNSIDSQDAKEQPYFVRGSTRYARPQTLNDWISGKPGRYTESDDVFAALATIYELETGRQALPISIRQSEAGSIIPLDDGEMRAQLFIGDEPVERITEEAYQNILHEALKETPWLQRRIFGQGLAFDRTKNYTSFQELGDAFSRVDNLYSMRDAAVDVGTAALILTAVAAMPAGGLYLATNGADTNPSDDVIEREVMVQALKHDVPARALRAATMTRGRNVGLDQDYAMANADLIYELLEPDVGGHAAMPAHMARERWDHQLFYAAGFFREHIDSNGAEETIRGYFGPERCDDAEFSDNTCAGAAEQAIAEYRTIDAEGNVSPLAQ